MNEEYLSKCVIDVLKRTVYIYSDEGSERQVTCETVEEFMNVLEFIRDTLDNNMISYSSI